MLRKASLVFTTVSLTYRNTSLIFISTALVQRIGVENERGVFGGKYLLALTNYAADGARSARVESFRHTSGEVGEASGFNGKAHGPCHFLCILRFGDGRVHEDCVSTEFHSNRCVRCRADARVNDDGRDR